MPKGKRYCGMCDAWVRGKECPKCGADTDKAEPEPRKPVEVVNLMDALRKSLEKLQLRETPPASGDQR